MVFGFLRLVWDEGIKMTRLELEKYVERQIMSYLCYEINVQPYIDKAIIKTENCMKDNKSKYNVGFSDARVPFSVFNTVQYCVFLVFNI